MAWFITLIILVIAVAVAIWFLNRFYRKATREIALVRTGFGGKTVVLDGGCLALPFLNQIAEVNMKTLRLEVRRDGSRSLITQDRLRIDTVVEFYVRVQPDAEGVATAAQALGGKTFRAAELQEIIEGKLVDGVQGVVAKQSLDHLHENRLEFVQQVKDAVSDSLARNGLELESVSLTQLDQTPFHALDENNAFNAVGMRRLAEVIAQNKKQRAEIEADAEVAVRQSQLEAIKRKLVLESEEQEAQAEQSAQIAESEAAAEQRAANARISKEREVRMAENSRDRQLREVQLNTQLTLEIAERQNQIDLARKAVEVAQAEIEANQIRAQAAVADESIQTERDKAVAERARQIALIRAEEQVEVDARRTSSAADTVRSQAEAAAAAQFARAKGTEAELQAKATGRKALAEADNALSDSVINMRIEQHKLDRLPELVGQMVKPVEKIEGIRINHISGLHGMPMSTPSGNGGGSSPSPVNQAIDGLLGMAVQLPVLQKLGRELGINLEQGLSQITEPPDDQSQSSNNKPGDES